MKAAVAALAIALAGFAHAAPPRMAVAEADEAARAEPKIQPAYPAVSAARARADVALVHRVSLAALPKAIPAPNAVESSSAAPVQVGFARSLPALGSAQALAAALEWQSLAGGARVAALSITSPDAAALRAGLVVEALPEGASLRFHAPGSAEVFEIDAAQVRATIERNVAAGDASDAARTFWSPVVEGETIAIEVELPPGVAPAALRVAVPVVSHLVASPRDGFAKASSACELDSMCYQDTWGVESSAVSRIIYTEAGSSFLCTGTLLADRDATTFTPYFLTAGHCIGSQTVASTMQNYWLWRAAACNSGSRGGSQTTVGGGTLLHSSGATDTAFLRLNSRPPAGVAFAGWIATPPSQGAAVTGIHHPGGDLQKISFGNVASFWSCTITNGTLFNCTGSTASASTFYGVSWRSGITEGGSSGSGLFTDNGRYLVGQLFGGNGVCGAPGTDFYGRFDLAYGAGLSQWLNATTNSVVPAADYSDLWWNAAESGWGLSFTQHAGAVFAAWFVYDAAGRAAWYVIPGGRWTSADTFTGDVYAATGLDPTAGAFDPARVTRTKVGTATLRFASTAKATFSYTVNGVPESREITREPFGNARSVASYADMWWNAAESGWGLSLNQQGDTLFGVWYSYAADGSPTWYVMPGGAWTAVDTYSGTLYRTASSGAYFGRPFDAASVVRTPAGRLTLRFIDANTAVMTYTLDGVSGTRQVTRQGF